MSAEEARQILVRFCNSHFNNPRETHEHARATIPPDYRRDDDIRMGAFITQAEKRIAELEAESAGHRAALAQAEEMARGIEAHRNQLLERAIALEARVAELEAEVALLQTAEAVLPRAEQLCREMRIDSTIFYPASVAASTNHTITRYGFRPTLLAAYNALREQQKGGV